VSGLTILNDLWLMMTVFDFVFDERRRAQRDAASGRIGQDSFDASWSRGDLVPRRPPPCSLGAPSLTFAFDPRRTT
jgi:hypothetical protein